MLMTVIDGLGVFVFALSGGLLGVQKRFDLFGVLVLSFVVAVTGGVMRDVLIGSIPPASISSWHNLAISLTGGLLTFFVYPAVESRSREILLFDAIGLGAFAVSGTQAALDHGIDPAMSAMLGMLSGIGGGIVRDLLAGDIPNVLRSDLYAVAALAAAGIVCLGRSLPVPSAYPIVIGMAVCFFLRVMAIYRGWRLPIASRGGDNKKQDVE